MANETVPNASGAAECRISDEDAVLVDKVWSLLEGINGYAASYEDGGLYSGVAADTTTVRVLGEMAIGLLNELKFGKSASMGAAA